MGRKPKPLSERKTTLFNFNCTNKTLIADIRLIALRENRTFGDIILLALTDYAKEHAPGNPQTQMSSFSEGGVQTLHQLVGRLRQKFYSRNEVLKREILQNLKAEGINGMERVNTADKIADWLREQGKKVYE